MRLFTVFSAVRSLLGARRSSNNFTNNSKGDKTDLVKNVVFVLVGPIELNFYLPRSSSKVNSLQLSNGLKIVFHHTETVLKFEVPNFL